MQTTTRAIPHSLILTCLVSSMLGASCAEDGDELGEIIAPATVCAAGSTVFGIDVSKWQGTIDWARVKAAGVKYAFIRVSDGIATIDDKFVPNWVGAGAQGIPRGVYQFFRPHRDPIAQADIVIDHLLEHGLGELPPVIDVEATNDQSPAVIAQKVGQWIDHVEAALGVTPIIYTGRYFWNDNVGSSAFAGYPLWIAHYTSAACPNIPDAWGDWGFWQYSSTGRVDGIAGDVDMNRFNGSENDLRALIGDPICRDDPNHQACRGTDLEVCSAQLRLTVIPCGSGTVCARKTQSTGFMCMDPRCSGTVGENGRLCASPTARAECVAGGYTALPCAASEVCEAGECVAEPGPVEPDPEPQPESTPEADPQAEVVEMAEADSTDGTDGAGQDAARVVGVARTVSGREFSPGGCGVGAMTLWSLPLLLWRRRRLWS